MREAIYKKDRELMETAVKVTERSFERGLLTLPEQFKPEKNVSEWRYKLVAQSPYIRRYKQVVYVRGCRSA